MIRSVIFLALFGVSLASYYKPKPTTYKCFQCEYRPPVTRTMKVSRQEPFEVQVPVTTQECRDEQKLVGYKVTKIEKRVSMHFEPVHGVDVGGYGEENVYDEQEPEIMVDRKPLFKTVKKCMPKTEYKTEMRYRTVFDTKTNTSPAGGFEPCRGPITGYSAIADGVDTWACETPCYVRRDGHGNISRGCYKGEFGVNPNQSGEQSVYGQTYEFCKGDYCNGSD